MHFLENLFTIQSFVTLLMLILLQAVLGIDNLLYISIESKRVAEDKQRMVRHWGIGLATGLRLVLLLVMLFTIERLKAPFFAMHIEGFIEMDVNVHSLVVLVGGAFIIYTAFKEILHMLAVRGRTPGEAQLLWPRNPRDGYQHVLLCDCRFNCD